jgi:hypothetical protein
LIYRGPLLSLGDRWELPGIFPANRPSNRHAEHKRSDEHDRDTHIDIAPNLRIECEAA